MSNQNYAHKTFLDAFDRIEKVIPFSVEWENGTGYMDHAVKKVKLNHGEQAKSIDRHNRKIVFTGTEFGTVVVFERHSDGSSGVLVCNAPREVSKMVHPDGPLTELQIWDLCGNKFSSAEICETISMLKRRFFQPMRDEIVRVTKATDSVEA